MKVRYALIALLTLSFWGCDDNTAGLGLGIFPENDQTIKGQLTTFDVTTKSMPTGRIYAKTSTGYVGKYTDEIFGTYEAGFLASLNCPDGLTFPGVYKENALNSQGRATNVMLGKDAAASDLADVSLIKDDNGNVIGNIHTVELYLWYENYFGDSLTACRLSVYELDHKLDQKGKYYTNIDPKEFLDINKAPLGSKVYTAVDYSLKDSIRNTDSYVPYVHLELKDSKETVGGEILKAARAAVLADGTSTFNFEKFSDAFPGVYVKSDYGDGTILYVFQVQMNVVYKCYAVDETTGEKLKKSNSSADSTYYGYRTFASTREVIQANQLKNDEDAIKERINQKTCTYIKSPAGIFTEATLPVSEIYEKLQADSLNAVKLVFSNYNQDGEMKFGMDVPSTVMLIREKYKDSFFENNELTDNITSFLTSHSSVTNQYTFSNISTLISDCIQDEDWKNAKQAFAEGKTITLQVPTNELDDNGDVVMEEKIVSNIEEWEKYSNWNKVVLIPVTVTYDTSTSSSGSANVISVRHDLKPGYVRLKGGVIGEELGNNNEPLYPEYRLKLEIVSTNFGNY